ncbi:Gfo/Idh/MocA family oxidoreductase [Actinacidiphila glaucinigra]|uniref:Gfo/Idh/MocA family protein n=1 Tax=Actinacidiphila glaucinigra TaxID=235986 RepID=UPI00324F1F78
MRVVLFGVGRLGSFHAATLHAHPDVSELVLADADAARAAGAAARLGTGARAAASVDAAFAGGADAVVIASATAAHAGLISRAVRAGLPAYCEKPVALDLESTVTALREVEEAGTVLQMGFQRRFDPGYRAAREAVRTGRLGRLHTVRALTSDMAPPPPEFVPLSGGLYRDCLIHDFDAVRWVTGREVVEVYATGANGGADFFRAAGDVDTAAALLTLDDGTLATATSTRYNGAGYDIRMELAGSLDQIAVGVGPRTPVTSVEPGAAPGVPDPWTGFVDRFGDAYRAEIDAFLQAVTGRSENPCDGREALDALLVAEACEVSRSERRPVTIAEMAEVAKRAAKRVG